SSTAVPFIIGMPATQTLSLMANFLPASFPDGAPLIEHFQYQALSLFSSGPGRYPVVRGYLTAGRGSLSSSSRRYEAITPSVNPRNEARSSGVSVRWNAVAALRRSSIDGFLTGMGRSPGCGCLQTAR